MQIDDEDVSDLENPLESTVELIKSHKPGAIVQFTLLRDEEEIKVDVTTVSRSSIPFEENFPSRLKSHQFYLHGRSAVDTSRSSRT